MMRVKSKLRLLFMIHALFALILVANLPGEVDKKALTFQDIMKFKEIQNPVISEDGLWVAYSAEPDRGDGEAKVHGLKNGTEFAVERGSNPAISKNAKWVAMFVKPKVVDLEKEDKEKPKQGLALLKTATGDVFNFEKVERFSFSDNSEWLAFLHFKEEKEVKKETEESEGEKSLSTSIEKETAQKKKRSGSTLVLRHLENGKEIQIADVLSFAYDCRTWVYERLKKNHEEEFGPFLQIDYSATPFYGSGERKEYFPHIVYDYDLVSAMRDMLVKQLFLEERQSMGGEVLEDLDFRAERYEPDAGNRRGEIIGLSAGQKLLLDIGRYKIEQLAKEFKEIGLEKKPVMMVLCEDTKVADFTMEHFASLCDENGNYDDENQVMVIHSDLKDKELEEARKRLDRIDIDDDPLRVVISVLMLREGFDKNNICVVVVLRATEADLLLEQIVGRGLRLMFPSYQYPELQDSKEEAYREIRRNKIPSSSLDFLFIVEHPRFRAFYDALKTEGYFIGEGDTSGASSIGDIIPIDAIPERIDEYDIAWPIQIFDEGRMPELEQIDISALPKYSGDFHQLRKWLSKLIIQETHVETGKKTKTWKLDNEYFDFAHFLRQASRAVAFRGKTSILSAKRAELAELIDDYVSEYCFGESIDFSKKENYSVLNYTLVFDHIVQSVHQTIIKLIEGYKYVVKGIWGRLSDVPRIMVRESKSVESDKSIYPRLGYQARGGGFERNFMIKVLNPSAEVLSFAKLDRRHNLKITYRDETGILRNYEVDFIIKTAEKNYLLETKADRVMGSPNVAVKAQAAVAWCEQASTVSPPDEITKLDEERMEYYMVAERRAKYGQSKEWEYLIISESLFRNNERLGFEAFVSLCQSLRDHIIAQAESKLFLI